MVEVPFNDLIDEEWCICIFDKVTFNVFYVIMKRVIFVQNFNRPLYQIFN